MKKTQQRRSGIAIMAKLLVLVKPLLHIMLLAILLGTAGYLCAIFITILASQVVLIGLGQPAWLQISAGKIMTIMVSVAVARGLLHYAEQYCNHFIAFKLLAIIRHEVFAALRKLCPAKLEGRDRGNLISVITTDIELLEVFYAHTISPIVIALLTSALMVLFLGQYHVLAAVWAVFGYVCVGILLPVVLSVCSKNIGMEYREGFGALNTYVLDSLRGVDETMQYGRGEEAKSRLTEQSVALGRLQKELNALEKTQRSVTNMLILLFSFGMLGISVYLNQKGAMPVSGVITCTIAMMGSFGPVVALSNLSNNLNQTLASGERVLSILEEKPVVEEVLTEAVVFEKERVQKSTHENRREGGTHTAAVVTDDGAAIDAQLYNVTFAYQDAHILENVCAYFEKGKITGVHGASGCGKSTMLKLLMRFWDADAGTVFVGNRQVQTIPTAQLRAQESYVLQDTQLFHDTIAANIGIGKEHATREEIMEAAKKASIHDFIMQLPQGYDTQVGELGDTLSGGEKQRIGIARAFLHDAPLLLLDEPTSNLDSLNEGIILKSLKEEGKERTVVLVSHRASTMSVADTVLEVE